MQIQAASVVASVVSPTEKYAAKMGELNGLLQRGYISQETFNRAAKQAKADLTGASEGMSVFTAAAATAAVAVGAMWAAWRVGVGIYEFFKSGTDEIVRQGMAAHRVGTSLESMAAMELLAGNQAEQLNHSLVMLSRRMSEAASGGAEARGVFQRLGLDPSTLSSMPFDQAFGRILDSINGLSSAADRANIGEKMFGREGVDLLERFRAGSVGIQQAIAEIKAHGGVGFTENDFRNVLDAQRSLKEMESTFSRIKLSLVSEFAPVVKNVADWIADISGPTGGGLREVFHKAALSLVDGLGAAVSGMEEMVIQAHRLEKAFENLKVDAATIAQIASLGSGKNRPGHLRQNPSRSDGRF